MEKKPTKKAITKEVKSKYPESETRTVKRSQLNFAKYNPKSHHKDSVTDMVRNFKKVGYLGGIIWNEETGNLIDGHKRSMALDYINKYDGTEATDYEIKVEVVNLDEKTEKEQNIFQTRSRTELDDELMRALIPDIDYKNAGLDEIDMGYYGFDLNPELSQEIADSLEEMYAPTKKDKKKPEATEDESEDESEEEDEPEEMTDEEKKQKVKEVKKATQEKAIEKAQNMDAYVMVSFETYKNKAAFMARMGYAAEDKYIVGEEFSANIEKIG